MTDAEKIKAYTFDQVNAWVSNMLSEECQNKSYRFTVPQLRDGTLKKKIVDDGYDDYAAVYCFFDSGDKVQYIGNAVRDIWRRLTDHTKGKKAIKNDKGEDAVKDDWWILILYGKPWGCTHERMEAELIHKMRPDLNKTKGYPRKSNR